MKSDSERAVAMRLAGASYAQIGETLGVEVGEVAELVADSLSAAALDSDEMAARIDLARLDQLLMGVWKGAARGDQVAVGQALKITAQRAALFDRLQASGSGSGSGSEVSDGVSVADRLAELHAVPPEPPTLSPVPDPPTLSPVPEEVDDG